MKSEFRPNYYQINDQNGKPTSILNKSQALADYLANNQWKNDIDPHELENTPVTPLTSEIPHSEEHQSISFDEMKLV